ncbi:MAG: hypothetical protein QM790_19050 [Nibricoccus sp.]
MSTKIWLVVLTLISVTSLGLAVSARASKSESLPVSAVPVSPANADEALKRASLLEAKLSALESRIAELERRPNQSPVASAPSLEAVDANIDSLVKVSSQNTQDVQKASQQIRELASASQGAFNAVAAQIQQLRGEMDKLSAKVGQR